MSAGSSAAATFQRRRFGPPTRSALHTGAASDRVPPSGASPVRAKKLLLPHLFFCTGDEHMTWETPAFVEIDMSAEIGGYQGEEDDGRDNPTP
jgi:hypothetical protein